MGLRYSVSELGSADVYGLGWFFKTVQGGLAGTEKSLFLLSIAASLVADCWFLSSFSNSRIMQ
ncbi:hypothetical protein UF06_18665 [Vibrio sp. S234-5]|nr:hypothetical protein UF06_18665 [Vibrio sp. S234-5]